MQATGAHSCDSRLWLTEATHTKRRSPSPIVPWTSYDTSPKRSSSSWISISSRPMPASYPYHASTSSLHCGERHVGCDDDAGCPGAPFLSAEIMSMVDRELVASGAIRIAGQTEPKNKRTVILIDKQVNCLQKNWNSFPTFPLPLYEGVWVFCFFK
jgi:hypothetical protein